MAALENRLLNYLETLSGNRPHLVLEQAIELPLFLRSRYKINSCRLFSREFLLALEIEGNPPGTPGEYEAHWNAFRSHLGEAVVLVIPVLQSFARNRLVRKGVSFIVPGSQMFLPTAIIDLRERQPVPKPEASGRFTPAAQCLVLFHLQRESLSGVPLHVVAAKTGYSPMMLTKVKSQLESAGICSTVRQGRTTLMRFPLMGRDLWDHALPFLSAPGRTRHWVQWDNPGHPALLAGISGLSRVTMIQDDPVPTYAICEKSLKVQLRKGTFSLCSAREDANVLLEAWKYEPLTLSVGKTVDPLSLYLSLRDSPDERVQQQLQALLMGMSW